DPFGSLLSHPGDGCEARQVPTLDGADQFFHRAAGQDGDRQLRSDPRDRHQFLEDDPLAPRRETIKCDDVLTHMGMNVDGDLGAEIGKNPEGCDWNGDLVAHSVNIDDDARGSFLHQLPAQVSDHVSSTRSMTPTTAASIGEFGSPTDVM